jgi:23S rRNA (cytidine1920-2'-O)/16S rRNA (cytidine1409-2'-O)-methyltransferase
VPTSKVRLDRLLVDRGLAPTREKSQALILAGQVLVNEQKIDKPGASVLADAAVRIIGEGLRYVSRAGYKLEAALDHFQPPVESCVVLDVGSSTGGFTDCVLQRGALRVHAIDSGTNQMDWKLRSDARVLLREQTNARFLKPDDIGEAVDLLTIDVSFISVTLLLPVVVPLLKPGGDAVILVKPQFEAGRGQVGKGGIVRDEAVRQACIERVRACAQACGLEVTGVIPSPILGSEGNQEYLMHGRKSTVHE